MCREVALPAAACAAWGVVEAARCLEPVAEVGEEAEGVVESPTAAAEVATAAMEVE